MTCTLRLGSLAWLPVVFALSACAGGHDDESNDVLSKDGGSQNSSSPGSESSHDAVASTVCCDVVGPTVSGAVGGANPSGAGTSVGAGAVLGGAGGAVGGFAGGLVGGTVGGGVGGTAGGASVGISASAPRATSASQDAGALVPTDPSYASTPTTNPFVLTASDPFSTFAADVDTASYDIFRRSVLQGALPARSEVRLEEYVNFFEYSYPAPKLEEYPFSISLAASNHVVQGTTKLLRIGIQGAKPSERPHANLVFLIDVSGSMSAENKLPLVKVIAKEALGVLAGTDTVSIVTYAADTRVRLAPTHVSDRSTIEAVIDALQSGGSTNGASGISMAYEQAAAGYLQDGINHVFLCTDGDFNVGISDTQELVHFIEQKRTSGVTLTALGFGDHNNDEMMNRVSDAGNGIYSVIYNQDQAIAYAHQRLLSSMIHIARDMKLQVEFNPDLVRAYRLLGYETRAVADTSFRDDKVDGGEIGAGHRVTALYEYVPAGAALPAAAGNGSTGDADAQQLHREVAPGELVRVKVRYKQPGAAQDAPAREVAASLTPVAVADDAAATDADTRWAIGVAIFAELLSGSPYVDKKVLPALRPLFEPSLGDDPARREFLTLYDKATPLLQGP